MAFLMNVPIALLLTFVFVFGAVVGSLLNVCVARLPLEKSLLWPSSHCGSCFRAIAWRDNIPLLSYWLLRGRCRHCGATFSIRYFLIELGTALGFIGLFLLEIIRNVHDLPFFNVNHGHILAGRVPWQAWVFFGHHAFLLSLLIVAAACDLDRREIPLGLTFFGAIVGLIGAIFFSWPWPNQLTDLNMVPPAGIPWWVADPKLLGRGLYPWPIWGPLPNWMPAGGWLAGLATGLAGIFAGSWLLRGVRFLFTKGLGREALGLGDADLMMMVGAFLGWQPVIVAFFAGALMSLGFAIVQAVVFRDNSMAFGPGLAAGSLVTMLTWRWIAPAVQPIFFNESLMLMLLIAGAAFMLLASVVIRGVRGPVDPGGEVGK
jgi:leader peptidase (prepilin peptidase)/N-methyltransferase